MRINEVLFNSNVPDHSEGCDCFVLLMVWMKWICAWCYANKLNLSFIVMLIKYKLNYNWSWTSHYLFSHFFLLQRLSHAGFSSELRECVFDHVQRIGRFIHNEKNQNELQLNQQQENPAGVTIYTHTHTPQSCVCVCVFSTDCCCAVVLTWSRAERRMNERQRWIEAERRMENDPFLFPFVLSPYSRWYCCISNVFFKEAERVDVLPLSEIFFSFDKGNNTEWNIGHILQSVRDLK